MAGREPAPRDASPEPRAPSPARLSFIIPALNEGSEIAACLEHLQPFRDQGHEVILVDGGSTDRTRDIAEPLVDLLLRCAPGRASQMNAGAARARGDVLVFVHADTRLPEDAVSCISRAVSAGGCWGRFDVSFSDTSMAMRVIAWFMNLRSHLTGIATGDQAIFVSRGRFDGIGGYAGIALMEDIELCRRLRRRAPPVRLRECVVTSARRWREHGVVRTVLHMWSLRLRYALGADPAALVREYE